MLALGVEVVTDDSQGPRIFSLRGRRGTLPSPGQGRERERGHERCADGCASQR